MGLRERWSSQSRHGVDEGSTAVGRRDAFKAELHQRVIDRLDLTAAGALDPEALTRQVRGAVAALLDEGRVTLSREERDALTDELVHETVGFGPLEPLLADPTITDILVNGAERVYVERYGKLERSSVVFRDDAHLKLIIDRIVAKVGRRIDEASPMVDARLPDGSRVNAIIPPLALDGPCLSIRRFFTERLTMDDLLTLGSLTLPIATLLRAAVRARLNVLVSGGTGVGKTTLLNILSSYVPASERIVTIEDSAELRLDQEHVVRLETRPINVEGRGEVTQRDLVRNSLRMRPDRIIVGEVRGNEVFDMLQAMNTGHDGSIATIHANSPRDALHRLEMMMLLSGISMPERSIREQIASAIQLLVHAVRFADGSRRITRVSEIVGMAGESIVVEDLWVYERQGMDVDGKVLGRFHTTGYRPRFLPMLEACGERLPDAMFDPDPRGT